MKTKTMHRLANYITILGIILVVLLAVSSCKKYEEGPQFSLKTKKERVANTWAVEAAFSDGENVTDLYDEYTLYTDKDGETKLAALYTLGNLSYEYETEGVWYFENDDEHLVLNFQDDEADREYEILKLKEDELWLENLNEDVELRLMPK